MSGSVGRYGTAGTTGSSWWFPPVALGHVAVLRLLAYGFVLLDVLVTTAWVSDHGDVPAVLHRPVLLARLAHLPTPTRTGVDLLRIALLAAACVALAAVLARATRLVRASGVAVFVLYGWWMLVAMSYGKVDHDRLGYLVLLGVLPTVGAAALGEQRRSVHAGWPVRMTQTAVVATYFLAGVEQAALRRVGLGHRGDADAGRHPPGDRSGAVDARDTPRSCAPSNGAYCCWSWLLRSCWSCAETAPAISSWRCRGVPRLHLHGDLDHLPPHLVALTAFLPLERLGRHRKAAAEGSTTVPAALNDE